MFCFVYNTVNGSKSPDNLETTSVYRPTIFNPALGEEISGWLLMAEAWVCAHGILCWICGQQSGTGTGCEFFGLLLSVSLYRYSIFTRVSSRPVVSKRGCANPRVREENQTA
jgi:hypothetical protein